MIWPEIGHWVLKLYNQHLLLIHSKWFEHGFSVPLVTEDVMLAKGSKVISTIRYDLTQETNRQNSQHLHSMPRVRCFHPMRWTYQWWTIQKGWLRTWTRRMTKCQTQMRNDSFLKGDELGDRAVEMDSQRLRQGWYVGLFWPSFSLNQVRRNTCVVAVGRDFPQARELLSDDRDRMTASARRA